MLLVLLLGVADFGRVFAAGITVEAAARNAAEVAAQEYLRNPPGGPDLSIPAPLPPDLAYYEKLHTLAARTACRESRDLANTTYIPDDPGTPADDERCTSASGAIPLVRVCVHDNADPLCGRVEFGETIPAGSPCTELADAPSNVMQGGSEPSRYVEVRICYRFTTLINIDEMQLPFGWDISVGEVYLQKDRAFTVGWYPPRPTPSPPPAPTPPPPTEAPTESPSPSPSPTATPTGSPGPTGPPTPTPAPTPTATPCPPPVASFTATPTSGKKPLSVSFVNTSTSGCAILTYLWNFGDGTTSPGQSPTHVFTVQGNATVVYTVTFTVTNQSGTSAPATTTITVTK
jgi:hypothetical protein